MKFMSILAFLFVVSVLTPEASAWYVTCSAFDGYKRDVSYWFLHRDYRLNDVDRQLSQSKSKVDTAYSATNSLKGKLSQMNSLIQKQEATNYSMRRTVDVLRKENDELENLVNTIRAIITKEQQRNADQDNSMAKATKHNHDQGGRASDLERMHAAQRGAIDGLRRTHAKQKLALENLEEINKSQDGSITAFEPENRLQDSEIAKVESDNSRQDENLEQEQSSDSVQTEKLASVFNSNSDQDAKLSAVDSGIKKIRAAAVATVNKMLDAIKSGGSKCILTVDMFMCMFREMAAN